MLPKKRRLSSLQVKEVFQKGKSVFGEEFSLISIGQQKTGGFGITVSSKNIKKATDRNRIKRTIFSFLKQNKINEKDKWVVFVVKKDLNKTDKNVLNKKIESLLKKAGI